MTGTFRAPAWTPLALLALAVGPALVFESTFGSFAGLVAGLGGVAVGLAVAWASTRFRWDLLTTAVVTIAAYLGLGGFAATPETSIGGVVPTLRSVQVLIFGVVDSWRDLLTVHLPAAGTTGPAVLPWLVGILTGLASGLLTVRWGRPLLGALPILAMAVIAVAWGPGGYGPPAWPSALWTAALLAWLAWCAQQARIGEGRDVVVGSRAATVDDAPQLLGDRSSRGVRVVHAGRRTVAALLTLALAGGIAVLAVQGRTPHRTVLRDLVEPPLQVHDYASPLASYRHYTTDLADQPMVTLSSLPGEARVRVGVMDTWDGITFTSSDPVVSGNGRYVPTTGRLRPLTPDAQRISVQASGLVGPWVPSVGAPQEVVFTGDRAAEFADGLHANLWADALLTTSAPRTWSAGYDLRTTVPPVWADGQLAGVATAQMGPHRGETVPDQVVALSQRVAAAEVTPLGRARAIERFLSKEGFYSSADSPQSRPGHRADRLVRMIELEQMIGDDEQYAALMALMLQTQGIPSRVVMGFYPEEPAGPGQEVVLRGRDAHAWVEVPFEGLGWARFDPTPPRDQVPQTDVPEPRSVPRPQVLQPPDPPEPPVELPPNVTDRDVEDRPDPTEPLPWGLILGVSGGVLALVGPVVAILAAKALRTRRRRGAAPDTAVRGAWAETLDLARDAGARLPAHLTRTETAHHLAVTFQEQADPDAGAWVAPGASVPAVVALARRADAADFSGRSQTADDARAAWAEVGTLRTDLARGTSWWTRTRRSLSLRSLVRRRPRTARRPAWPWRRNR